MLGDAAGAAPRLMNMESTMMIAATRATATAERVRTSALEFLAGAALVTGAARKAAGAVPGSSSAFIRTVGSEAWG
jgi:hypothetical protein